MEGARGKEQGAREELGKPDTGKWLIDKEINRTFFFMTYYDYDEGPQLDLLQVILGFVLGMMVCGLISLL